MRASHTRKLQRITVCANNLHKRLHPDRVIRPPLSGRRGFHAATGRSRATDHVGDVRRLRAQFDHVLIDRLPSGG
jgi:hypothetical protein